MATDPKLFADLEARGIVKQVTDPGLAPLLAKEPVTLYCGFDPTSDSLHLGSLLPVLTLRRFQRAGHRIIAVVGGATGMIGDPSGKSAERSLLDRPTLAKNLAGIRRVIERFLVLDPAQAKKEGVTPAIIVNNGSWFEGLSYLDFLRDVGKHFTVNHMLAKESVRARLEDRDHGISYTEFSYMLLQAYDFYVLAKDQGCRLQIGGSDQWGNITAGVELNRRMRAALDMPPLELFGMTWPLVSKADGTKFGKSEQGNVWLTADRTSAYQFYQFLLQSADADVATFLKFFTFLPIEEIHRLEGLIKTEPEKREAQKALARELTALVHGTAELANVEKASQALFGTEIRDLDAETLLSVFADAPSTDKPRASLEGAGLPLVDALADSGLCPSKGQARKDVQAGGIYVNNARVQDVAATLKAADLIAGRFIALRKGKKTYHLLRFV